MPPSCQLKATAPVADSVPKTTPSIVAKVNCCLVMKNSHANLTPAPLNDRDNNRETETETATAKVVAKKPQLGKVLRLLPHPLLTLLSLPPSVRVWLK